MTNRISTSSNFPQVNPKKAHKLGSKASDVPYKFHNWQIIMQIQRLFECICNYPVHHVEKTLGKSWRVESCANQKPIHDFPVPDNTTFCSISHRLAGISLLSYVPRFDPFLSPFWEVMVGLGDENGINQIVHPTLHFDFYTHYMPILHHLAIMQNVADRETTDRLIGIGCLCTSIGGQIIRYNIHCTIATITHVCYFTVLKK